MLNEHWGVVENHISNFVEGLGYLQKIEEVVIQSWHRTITRSAVQFVRNNNSISVAL